MWPANYLILFLGVFIVIPNRMAANPISYDFSSEEVEEDYLTALSNLFYSAFYIDDINDSDSSESKETYLICRNCTVILGKATEDRSTIQSIEATSQATVANEIARQSTNTKIPEPAGSKVDTKETTPLETQRKVDTAKSSSSDTTTPMTGKTTTASEGKKGTTVQATGAVTTTPKA